MKRRVFHILAGLLAAASALAQDTVVFKNGDILSGRIIKQTPENIYFRTSAFGPVSLSKADIAEIRSKLPEAGTPAAPKAAPPAPPPPQVPVPPKKAVAAPPAATPGPTATLAAPQTAAKKKPLAPPPVAKPKPKPKPKPVLKPKKSPWTGQAGLEVAMREKNTTTAAPNGQLREKTESYDTYRVYGHLNWKGRRNNLNWSCTYRYSRDETEKRDDYFNVTQKYRHDFEEKIYYAEAKTIYQNDYSRDIKDEYLQTAEIGRKWFNRPRLTLSTSFGGGYHQFERDIPYGPGTTREPEFIIDQSIRWQMIDSLTLFQKYTHLGDTKKYHFVFTAGLENKLVRDVFLRLEYRVDRDTEISYDDRGYYDKALRTSLLYKF